jgi:hypothetical protein
MPIKRVLGTAGVGLGTVVWALTHAAQGEWAFFALAGVLSLATQLTIVELFEKRPRAAAASVSVRLPEQG